MSSSDHADAQAIQELRRMAQLYRARGLHANAEQLLDLAERMELRVKRNAKSIDASLGTEDTEANPVEET